MPALGVYLIYAAVVLRATVVLSDKPDFPIIVALLACYAFLLMSKNWMARRKLLPAPQYPALQLAYLFLQSLLVIIVLVIGSYEDFLAMLFIPLSLDAVSFFGRRVGYISIMIFSMAMTVTLLFSDVGRLFGLVMGILYSGICFLVGGYAYQVQKAQATHDQNEQMFHKLQTAYSHLQGYSDQKASLAIEHERNRLARELHDSVTQTVFSMNLAAQSAQLLLAKEPPRAKEQLARVEELAASALHEIQSLVSQLKPRSIVGDGLPVALRRLTAEQKIRDGLQISLEIHGEQTLSEAAAAGLYSIAHEALTNISKHSGTGEATVHLDLEAGRSCLEIEDHGAGFDPAAILEQRGHLGLASMFEQAREIGWSLSVISQPGQGTRVQVRENPSGGQP
jgi:signal transduction histidine kinase